MQIRLCEKYIALKFFFQDEIGLDKETTTAKPNDQHNMLSYFHIIIEFFPLKLCIEMFSSFQ